MREGTSPLLLSAVILNGLVLALILARAGTRTPALRWLAALVAVLTEQTDGIDRVFMEGRQHSVVPHDLCQTST